MKNTLIILLLFACGFSHGKELPSPFWYNLSKKILVETQRLITADEEPATPAAKPKAVAKANKVVKAPLKCQQSKEVKIQAPLAPREKDTFQEL